MPNPTLPEELLNHIVDHLDIIHAFRNYCLVSKSWIPRTRRHLFAKIEFDTEQELHSWRRMFPDPSTPPARFTRTLLIERSYAINAADAEEGGWIRGFSHIPTVSLAPFHGFSPIKSLCVDFSVLPSSRAFSLILSLHLLEDLKLVAYDASGNDGDEPGGSLTGVQTSGPLAFTGSLHLFLSQSGMKLITRRLLSLPGGICFWELVSTWFHEEDPLLIVALAEKCSHTIEMHRLLTFCFHLDRLLVRFLESRLARAKVVCTARVGEERDMRGFIEYLLPELTRRGMFDLVELGTGNGLRIEKPHGRFQPVSAYFGHHV